MGNVRLFALLALVLALAGCSAGRTTQATREPTAPSPVAVAPTLEVRPVGASTAEGGTTGASSAPSPARDSAPIPAGSPASQAQLIAAVFARVAPAVVLIQTEQGLGSGFLIDDDGHITTNNHVVEGASNGQVLVSFSNLFQAIGTVVGRDPSSDTAVVHVEQLPDGVQPVGFGDSSQIGVGDLVIAIGNPLGQERTVTSGIISAVGRTIAEPGNPFEIGGAIQTDAAINPGNSGGPLLNDQGQVIGMNTAILSPSGTSSGIGFAVPVNLIRRVIPELIASGSYAHPYLGIQMADVTNLAAEREGLPGAGVLIQPSSSDSPVASAGLGGPAILKAIDGTAITSSADVISYLELNRKPGDTVALTLLGNNGEQSELRVQLGARPSVEDRAPRQVP
ncbi:MAG: trypsin-like serine protease [Chloroflexales bacterium]|nr:trypsin-like serine protease [Chloroflexales bacterium]